MIIALVPMNAPLDNGIITPCCVQVGETECALAVGMADGQIYLFKWVPCLRRVVHRSVCGVLA